MSAVIYNDQDRAFHYALLFSVALHAALLFGFNAPQEPASPPAAAPGPIVARLVEPAPPAAPAPAPQPQMTAPQAQESAVQEKPQLREQPAAPVKPVPAAKPRPLAKPATKAPAAPPAPSVAQPEMPSDAAPSAPATATVPGGAPSAPAGAPSGPGPIAKVEPGAGAASPGTEAFDAGSLAQYRLQLISAARKYKRYPRVAMDNNWEGDVVVRMVIGANGTISALSVKSSSGYDVLDQQAMEMFKRAKPLVQIPPALRGRQFTIELRAIYSLKDQESS